jgi:predicted RNase H-like HicB family nuclease
MEYMQQVRAEFNSAKGKLQEAKNALQEVLNLTFQVYREQQAQLPIPFEPEGGES